MVSSDKDQSLFLSWFLLILLSFVWGSSFILMKKGLTAFDPAEVAGIRIFSASLFLIPVSLRHLKGLKRHQWIFLFMSGFWGSLIPAFLFPLAQTKIDSAVTGVLNSLTPLFTIIIGAVFFKVRFNIRIITGISIGFIGSIILILANHTGSLFGFSFFTLLVVLATMCYGLNVNIIKYFLHEIKPLHIASISMMLIGPFAFLYLLIFSDIRLTLLEDPSSLIPLSYIVTLGVLGTAVAMALFNKLIKLTNTVFASSVTYLIPVIAVIWGIIDGEILNLQHYIGMIAIIIGVLIANKGKKA
jgi:drug/metabolite transporter (DMT)-like permease